MHSHRSARFLSLLGFGCRRGLALLLWFAALTIALHANMASPIRSGDNVGEPGGPLRDVVILNERLLIDLRPLAGGTDSAIVEARYHVRNGGAARMIQLLFVAVAMRDSEGTVMLDGNPVAAGRADPRMIPLRWRAPATTPPFIEGEALPYQVDDTTGLFFELMLPAGEHTITVRYRARVTCQASSSDPLRYWQLAYVLSPAKEWGKFGGLDLTVLLPAAWRAVSDPPLDRRADSLVGHWDHLPSDAIALTLQAPRGTTALTWISDLAIDLILLIGGVYGCIRAGAALGRRLARRKIPSVLALPVGILLGIVWGAAVMFGASLHHNARIISFQRSWSYGYGHSILWMLLALAAVVAGTIVTQGAVVVAARRERRISNKSEVEELERKG